MNFQNYYFNSHEEALAEGHEVVTRKEALQKGGYNYYPGKPCKRGHFSLRATSTGNCLTCKWGLPVTSL